MNKFGITDKGHEAAGAILLVVIIVLIATVFVLIMDSCKGTEALPLTITSDDFLTPFYDLLDAIEWVESRGDANAVGDWTEWKELSFDASVAGSSIIGQGPKVTQIKISNDGKYHRRDAQAVGAYQIHQIYVRDVNRILALHGISSVYSYGDRYNKGKSRAMVMLYTEYYGTRAWDEIWELGIFETDNKQEGFMKYFELMARIHNGGPDGYRNPKTKAYWLKVKERLGK